MTGSYELCLLIDGVVKQFPIATIEIDKPFYKGHAKAMCMDNPVQEVIIGNIPGELGLWHHSSDSTEVMARCGDIDKRISGSQDHTITAVGTKEVCDRSQYLCDTRLTRSSNHTTAEVNTTEVEERPSDQSDELKELTPSRIKGGAPRPLGGRVDYEVHADHGVHRNFAESDESLNTDIYAAVQTMAMKQRELKPPKPLKVSSINGLDIGPEQLIEQQRSDETLKRYWQLANKP